MFDYPTKISFRDLVITELFKDYAGDADGLSVSVNSSMPRLNVLTELNNRFSAKIT
jgi:hypothetical protein